MTNLQRWAEEQTATTEQAVSKIKSKQVIIDKLNDAGEAFLRFKDGREIHIDKLNAGGWQVSDFKVSGTYWDSDYKARMPIHKLDAQQDFDTAEDAADFVASRI